MSQQKRPAFDRNQYFKNAMKRHLEMKAACSAWAEENHRHEAEKHSLCANIDKAEQAVEDLLKNYSETIGTPEEVETRRQLQDARNDLQNAKDAFSAFNRRGFTPSPEPFNTQQRQTVWEEVLRYLSHQVLKNMPEDVLYLLHRAYSVDVHHSWADFLLATFPESTLPVRMQLRTEVLNEYGVSPTAKG